MPEEEAEHTNKELEERLSGAMKGREIPEGLTIPKRMDDAVLKVAGEKARMILAEREREAAAAWRKAYIAAAAAVALILAGLIFVPRPGRTPVVEDTRPVDIVDAYLLACELDKGDAGTAQRDFNGDGIVNGEDVDALARAAVSLKGRSG